MQPDALAGHGLSGAHAAWVWRFRHTHSQPFPFLRLPLLLISVLTVLNVVPLVMASLLAAYALFDGLEIVVQAIAVRGRAAG